MLLPFLHVNAIDTDLPQPVMLRTFFALFLIALTACPAVAQTAAPAVLAQAGEGQLSRSQKSRSVQALREEPTEEPQLFYVVGRKAILFGDAGLTLPYAQLKFQEPVYVLGTEAAGMHVRTRDGAHGYVSRKEVSDVWIRVSKRAQSVYVFKGGDMVKEVAADLGYNKFADKERRGSYQDRDHWRTPEGSFYVVQKNSRSQYYRAFVLNYPTAEDAERGYANQVISKADRDAIVRAQEHGEAPPMNTDLGGMIEIHGKGTGSRTNWTQGCIAVSNPEMDWLWGLVQEGTPVLIEP